MAAILREVPYVCRTTDQKRLAGKRKMKHKECPGHLVWHFLLFKADYFGGEAETMTICMKDENTTRTTVLEISGVKFGWPSKQS